MYKLLIVDDEQIEREGLKAILQHGLPEIIIEQAKNGNIALQLAEQFQPDLILMDVKMPGINGLEAVERISAYQPSIKFIMVTAYDTFDYARKAIKLGVKDYLLKPSKASEIVATVQRVLDLIEEERKTAQTTELQLTALQRVLPIIETDIVTQLLFDHVHEVHLDELVGLLGVRTANENYAMTVLLPPGAESCYSAIKEKVRKMGSGWVGAMYGRQIPIIVFPEADRDRSYRSQAVTMARELLAVAKADGNEGWFVGIGNVYESLDQIRQSYQEALMASIDPSQPVKYRFYEDTPVLGVTRDGYTVKQLEQQLFDRIRLGQWEQVRGELVDFIRRYENEGASILHTQQRVLELLWIASRVLLEMGIEIDTPMFSFQVLDYRQLRTESELLLERMKQSFAEHHERLEPDTIQQIKQYIADHSHEDISLEAIGRMVGLSPFYISKMFKDQLGINYIDFLTDCRIKKAIKLMGDPERSLKEITYMVGYHDPNYFSKVFKKMCEVSPTEYRKTLLGKSASS
ncbi:two-component system, response regulator YesN [Paenibacillus catalpae]|uniref:Two-component system, response regulator YesN n=1 Tax=Paenibacillus catalpae TaxID=1045775 RepID=A0A1I2I757_9BACL|nr:response regulator [Paenibacillus catalpae]SFF36927.1 two-component system, response regulator YesN [Paenibacillus catalpae]